jgi:hypothetical protein
VRDVGPLKNTDIRGAQTHVHESGGRQPAVVPETAPAMAIGFRGLGVITFTRHDRTVHYGWLTPAALGARPRFAEK